MPHTLTIELPYDVEPEEARLLLSMKLFEEGRVSLGTAAEMAGYTKRTFMELLGKRGIPVIRYPVEELEVIERLAQESGPGRSAEEES